ncbi:ATP-binding protein [Kitasatospora viridis]|uniref:Regulatory LuxR family protein n=1 Tax=Kitasatospora viridis TaxID=281105 RepID=A0A561UGZ7_9ACTN|nr:AAA family ATPase [Kitasatospora viridis]TWF98615.1 regulatory LuxR family protein [Kitasatospora viridis]
MTLLARDAELAALAAAHREAAAGEPVTVLVGGEPGIGKTRLVTEFTTGLPDLVLTGGCLALGADGLPYAPFTAVLRRLLRLYGPDWLTTRLPGPGPYALAHWLPGLGPAPEGDRRARLFEELLALLEAAAADRGLVLVLEDVHWADPASAELLLFLVRNLAAPRTLLLVTHRDDEPADGHPVRALLAALARLPQVRRVDPGPLGPADLARLAGDGLSAARLAEVHRRSGGNPLFAGALLDSPGDRTPAPLRDLLLAGVRELPESAQAGLRAAAVLGEPVGPALLATVAGQPEPELEAALRPAVRRGLLLAGEEGYAFRHALLRAAVAEELLPGERRRLHAACARALTADPALLPAGQAAAALALHWHAAGEREAAYRAAWTAAAAARAGYAYGEELRLLERMLTEPRAEPEVLRAAVRAALDARATVRGLELADAALAVTADPAERALLLETRSLLKHRQGQSGLDDLREAVGLLPCGPSGVRGRLLATLASRLAVLSRHAEAATAAGEALRLGETADDPAVRALALVTLAAGRSRAGEHPAAVAACAEALRLAAVAEDDDTLVLATVMLTMAHKAVGDYPEAVRTAERGLALATRRGLAGNRGAVLASMLADALFRLGRWPQAREVLERALSEEPPPLYRAVLLTTRGLLDLAEGEPAQAAAAAEAAAVPFAAGYPGPGFRLPERELAVLHRLAEGDWPAADRLLGELLDDPELPEHATEAWPLLLAGYQVNELGAALGARQPAAAATVRQRAAKLGQLTDAMAAPGPVERAERVTAQAWAGADWAPAVAAWRALDQPYPLAQALLRAGQAALTAGDRPDGSELLREAAGLAERLGARPLAGRIAELTARERLAGAAADRLGLTPRELEVLELVAQGRSNREIGERLFISAKTAGVHVSNLLPKLGAASRTEAAALALQLGLVRPAVRPAP